MNVHGESTPAMIIATARRGALKRWLVIFLVVSASADVAHAQLLKQDTPPTRGVGLSVARDREAEAWLKKAAQAARDQDWKLLTDTLFRVVSLHGGNTVAEDGKDGIDADGASFRSATVESWRILKAAGPEGLDAFRLTYEAEAGKLLAEAEAAHDESLLRSAVARYLPTHSGTVAADTLANWLIDAGRWAEARRALDSTQTFPTELVPAWSISARRALLSVAGGRREDATALIDALIAKPPVDAPADFADRMARVKAAAMDPSMTRRDMVATDWPYLLGRTEGAGRMPAMTIDLATLKPTLAELPGGQLIDAQVGRELCQETHRAPAWNAVSDGRTLFVATPNGFAAFDPISLQCRWAPFQSAEKTRKQLAPMRQDRMRGFRNPPRNRSPRAADAPTQRAVLDEIAGTLSVIDGQVFCVEQVQLEQGQAGLEQEDEIVPNTLSAYDAQSGKLLWQKGRSGPDEDGLKSAHFLSPPVQAGRYVAALYAMPPDVGLVAIDHNGKIARRTVLGSIPEINFPGRSVLPLACADGDLFVPTGMGRLFCFDVGDFSLRWAAAYPRKASIPDPNVRFPGMVIEIEPTLDSWYASPPLVTGELIVLAPQDGRNVLLAFDRATGRRRWSARSNDFRYLVGADERAVYATGRTVAAFELSNGTQLWAYDDEPISITGRAALVGDRLLVPTMQGLLTIDATNGEKVSLEPMGEEGQPPGNLLAMDGTLYSVELNAIRRFGDATQELRDAYARMRMSPRDMEARLRTALLQVMRRNWKDAMELLDATQVDPAVIEPGVREQLAHLTVVALLGQVRDGLSGAEGAEHGEIEPWLRRATATAIYREDVVQVALARADFLQRKERPADACLILLAAARDAGGAAVYRDDGWRMRASAHIAERLEKLWSSIAETERPGVLSTLRDTVAGVMDAGAENVLRDIADATGFCDIGAEADVLLARRLIADGAPESAEFHLRRAAARTASPRIHGDALAQLVLLLLADDNGAIARPTVAAAYLKQLALLPPETPLEPQLAERANARSATVADLLAALLPRVEPAKPQPFPTDDAAYELARQAQQSHLAPAGQVLSFGPADDELLRYSAIVSLVEIAGDGMGTMLRGGTEGLIGIDLRPGNEARARWQLELPVLPSDEATMSAAPYVDDLPPGGELPAVSGAIVAMPTSKGVYCIGLQSGAVLSQPVIPPTGRGAQMPRQTVVAAGDMFVLASDPRTVIGMPARADASPWWRRTFGASRVVELIAAGPTVVVVPSDGDSAWVLDARSGRTLRRIQLDAEASDPRAAADPQATSRLRPCMTTVGGLLIVAGQRQVTAWNPTSGEQVWKRRVSGGVSPNGLLRLGTAHVGVSSGRRFQVLAVADGEPVGAVEVSGAMLPPIHASMINGGRLVMALMTDETQQRQVKMEWFNLLNGKLIKKNGPWPTAVVTPRMLDGSSEVVAVVENIIQQEEYRPMRGNQFRAMEGRAFTNVLQGCRLCLFTRKDGERVGRPMEVSQNAQGGERAAPVIDLLVRDDQVTVITETGRQAIIVPKQ